VHLVYPSNIGVSVLPVCAWRRIPVCCSHHTLTLTLTLSLTRTLTLTLSLPLTLTLTLALTQVYCSHHVDMEYYIDKYMPARG